jgi:hypothetical protein
MDNEFCPKCRVLRSLVAVRSTTKEKIDKGKKITIEVISYSCPQCGMFVKSVEKEKTN